MRRVDKSWQKIVELRCGRGFTGFGSVCFIEHNLEAIIYVCLHFIQHRNSKAIQDGRCYCI